MAFRNKSNARHEAKFRASGARKRGNSDEDEDGRSVNKLKKRIRDLERQLNREQSAAAPANVKIERERELNSARVELISLQNLAQRSRMISKYHMVRFFERKKAARFLKRARQKLEDASEDVPEKVRVQLEQEVHNFEVDLNYTMYYPLEKTYVSLYADGKDQDLQQGGDQEMRKAVEKAMKDGTLQKLRDMPLIRDRGSIIAAPEKKPLKSVSTQQKGVMDGPDAENEQSDDEDGAGFFE